MDTLPTLLVRAAATPGCRRCTQRLPHISSLCPHRPREVVGGCYRLLSQKERPKLGEESVLEWKGL